MNNSVQISCDIDTTNPLAQLGLEIRLDSTVIFNCDYVVEATKFTHDLNDSDAEHLLEFVLKGKADNHTLVDENGNIVSDSRLIISNLSFDGIALNHIFSDQAVYTHNFNDTKETTINKFYGEMGCNGTVSLRFTSPIYLWLLEVM